MSKAYAGYECVQCGQTATDQEVKVGDVLDLVMPCWACGGDMQGYLNWDDSMADAKEPTASSAGEGKIKIESV